jgi:ATP-dependent DNA helicase RecG
MNLATDDGMLNLAGLLLFGEQPERFKPQFVVKAVKYPGPSIHTSKYDDTEDFSGSLRSVFDAALAFVLRNLHKVQAGGVNSPGVSEIPPVVFEELLVNALVHRDYLISAPIRLFVFDDRIEVISPGTLPNNLTVANIRAGNSNLRNPILASFVAKGVLPYRGLGSGVPRALEAWPDIEFRDDRDGSLFVATVKRKVLAPGEVVDDHAQKTTQKTTQKTPQKLLDLISQDPSVTRQSLAEALGITPDGVKYHLRKLQDQGRLRRVGPDKGGHWEVVTPDEHPKR